MAVSPFFIMIFVYCQDMCSYTDLSIFWVNLIVGFPLVFSQKRNPRRTWGWCQTADGVPEGRHHSDWAGADRRLAWVCARLRRVGEKGPRSEFEKRKNIYMYTYYALCPHFATRIWYLYTAIETVDNQNFYLLKGINTTGVIWVFGGGPAPHTVQVSEGNHGPN